jgi:hypothetical protein
LTNLSDEDELAFVEKKKRKEEFDVGGASLPQSFRQPYFLHKRKL